jgi:hypothetical protein
MQNRKARENLNQLHDEALKQGLALRPPGVFSSWKGRVRSVLSRSLGEEHHLLSDFLAISYSVGVYPASQESMDRAFLRGVHKACGILEAALFEIDDAGNDDDAVDETAFDPDLWAHVQGHVQNAEWQTVASQTAIFVEDRIRQWCGEPKGSSGQTLVGKGLYAAALANDAQYRLGKEPGEWEGWRGLGMGFAQALGNVDRHNIQKRDDAKRYAIGVLGLGSLLLTQLRFQHGEDLHHQ